MKKILLILFVSIFLFSCENSIEDARMVKLKMSTKELEYVMGKPFSIELSPGKEEWYYKYNCDGFFSKRDGMVITVSKDSVRNFYSY